MTDRLMIGFQVIFVVLFFTGIDAETNPATRCLEMMKFQEDIDSFVKLGDRNQLDFFCTNMTRFFSCINSVMKEETGFSIRELVNFWFMKGTESGKFLQTLIDLENYVEGQCRNGTQLNTDFMMDILCFKGENLEVIPVKHCMKRSAFAYFIFSNSQPERQFSEKDGVCIVTAYQLACIATTVHEECGIEAFNRYKNVLKKTGFFRTGTCSSDLMVILKTTFLESLNMPESEKNIYRTILDVKRRRR